MKLFQLKINPVPCSLVLSLSYITSMTFKEVFNVLLLILFFPGKARPNN